MSVFRATAIDIWKDFGVFRPSRRDIKRCLLNRSVRRENSTVKNIFIRVYMLNRAHHFFLDDSIRIYRVRTKGNI